MKYIVLTIIAFIILAIMYNVYDSFKKHLLQKYNYCFYDDDIFSSLIFSEIIGGISTGLKSVGVPNPVFVATCTISVIALLIVLLTNVTNTSLFSGILVTVLQAIFAVYIILLLAIVKEQLKDIFSTTTKKI